MYRLHSESHVIGLCCLGAESHAAKSRPSAGHRPESSAFADKCDPKHMGVFRAKMHIE